MKTTFTIAIVVALSAALSAGTAIANESNPPKKGVLRQADSTISGQGYGMAGCGLGSIAFGEEPGFSQVFAATTNGTSGNQTFGISTGTSNCDQQITAHKKDAAAFIFANRESLEKDIARGQGQTLSGLSAVMGCTNQSALGQKLQHDFKRIFPSQNVGTDAVVDSILREVRIDPRLAANCTTIS